MNKTELRQTADYKMAVDKIRGYKKGFAFTIKYSEIPVAKGNALKIIIHDCIEDGLLESIAIGLDIHGNFVEETYRRL